MSRFAHPRQLWSNGVALTGFLFAIIILLIPVVTVNAYTLSFVLTVALFATFAMTWDFFSGLTGYINFGHTFLLGVAGYSSALVNYELGLSVMASIIVATLVTGLVGITLIAGPTLRLSGVYFVTFTLILPVIGEKLVIVFSGITGGAAGYTFLQPFASVFQGLTSIAPIYIIRYYFIILTFLLTFGLLVVLSKSEIGNILRGVQQNELLLSTQGIDPQRFKIIGFGITSLLVGFNAAIWTHFQLALAPSSHLTLTLMIDIIIAAIIGGIGTIVGPMIGMIFLQGFGEMLRTLESIPFVGDTLGIELSNYRLMFTMLIALAFVYYYPSGIYPVIRNRIEHLTALLGSDESAGTESNEGRES